MDIRAISQLEQEEISNYLALDEELLYSLIPPYLPEYQNTVFAPEGQITAGKKTFKSMEKQLHKKLCKQWKLCKRIDDPTFEDTTKLIVLIGDVIATPAVGVPPFLIASIVVKIGVREFCNCKRKPR